MDSKEKFIRTANGPKSKDLFLQEGKCCLPYEHIIQNICEYLIENR